MNTPLRIARTKQFINVVLVAVLLQWGGSEAFALDQLREIQGAAAGDEFGSSVACVTTEVLAGGPNATLIGGASFPSAGLATLIEGSTGAETSVNYPTPQVGTPANSFFGTSVTFLDDVSSDGLPELVVGAPGMSFSGEVHIYYSRATAPAVSLQGSQTFAAFGQAVAGITNLFGIGTPGLLVGTPFASGTGTVDVYDGLGSTSILTIVPPVNDSATGFGATIAELSDIDNDSISDFAISASLPGGHSVYVYSGASKILLGRLDDTSGRLFGNAISDVGDLNGDGVGDFAVGAPKSDNPIVGQAIVYSGISLRGGNSGPTTLCVISGEGTDDSFGSAVAGIGPDSSSGKPLFVVGAPQASSDTGKIYVYGYQDGNCVLLDSAVGSRTGAQLGRALNGGNTTSSCDFNDDKIPDFVAGTSSDENGADRGSAILYSGIAPTPTPTPTPTPSNNPTTARLTFRIDRNGTLALKTTYDALPDDGCLLSLYARTVAGGKRGPVVGIGSLAATARVMNFAVGRLPKVQIENDAVPEIHMIAVTTCGDRTVSSNVFARYLNCGLGNGVSSSTWTSQFKRKFRKKF